MTALRHSLQFNSKFNLNLAITVMIESPSDGMFGLHCKEIASVNFPQKWLFRAMKLRPFAGFWIVTLLCLRCPYCKLGGRAPILGKGEHSTTKKLERKMTEFLLIHLLLSIPIFVYYSISSFISISNPNSISIFFPSPSPSSSLSVTSSPFPTSTSISLSSFYPFRTENLDVVFV